ncbi:hypothetical protein KA005_63680, partial [bacterium]|nr:hypothetical protein [bacterium]
GWPNRGGWPDFSIFRGKNMIDHNVVKEIKASVGSLLSNYAKVIDCAMAEEGNVTISLPVKIKQSGPNLDVDVGIGFVKERVKDAMTFTVDGQKELFGPDGVNLEVGINWDDTDGNGVFGDHE